MKKFVLALALFCAININQHEAISVPTSPTTISYQGVLTDGNDELVVDGTYSVTFKLYDVSSGGTALWSETQGSVSTVNGLFNVDLGSVTGVTGVDFTKQLYLEVTVGSTVLSPRIKFTAQPYAFMAKTITETLPLTKGGTGATTVQGAKDNLGISTLETNYTSLNSTVTNQGNTLNSLVSTVSDLQADIDGLGTLSTQDADSINVSGGGATLSSLTTTNDATLNSVKVGKGVGNISTNTALGNNTLASNTTGNQNTAVGQNALAVNTTGANNTSVGQNSLALNTTGGGNTAVGRNALSSVTTASENTAVGRNALNFNTATGNTGIGYYALRANTTATDNTAVGNYSQEKTTTGIRNNSLGASSLRNNTIGHDNVAIGTEALKTNTTGYHNVAIGDRALASQVGDFAAFNTAVGSTALFFNESGTGNTALGFYSGVGDINVENLRSINDDYATFIGYQATRASNVANSTKLENITAIGKNAQVGASNSIVLGGTGDDAVSVGIGTKSPTAALDINVVEGRQGALITKQSGNTNPGLEINTLSGASGTTLKVSQASTDNGAEIEYNGAGNDGSALLITVKNDGEANNTDASGIYLNNELNGDNAKGLNLNMYGNGLNTKGIELYMEGIGDDAKGIDIKMLGTGLEQKGIYIDLASGYDFAAEDSRMGAAIGINDGIGLMVANTHETEPTNIVKLATDNNALEVVGSSSITGAITLEDESPLIQGAGTGEFLISSAGDLRLESTGNLTLSPTGNLVIPNGAGAGKVLTSDASGNATWADAPAGGGSGGSGGVELISSSTFSGTSNGTNYVTAKTITVPSAGLYQLSSFFDILCQNGDALNILNVRLKQGSNIITAKTNVMTGNSFATNTYVQFNDVINLTSTTDLTLEILTEALSRDFSGNVKLLKLTEPGGTGGSSSLTTASINSVNNSNAITIDMSSQTADIITVNVSGNDSDNNIAVTMPTGTDGQVKYFRITGINTSDALTFDNLVVSISSGGNQVTAGPAYPEFTFMAFYIGGKWRAQSLY